MLPAYRNFVEKGIAMGHQPALVIEIADTMYQVQDACGQPHGKQNVDKKRLYITTVDEKHKLETVTYVPEWIYKRDSGLYVLIFVGSRLVCKEFFR
jgi:hypothetical protein